MVINSNSYIKLTCLTKTLATTGFCDVDDEQKKLIIHGTVSKLTPKTLVHLVGYSFEATRHHGEMVLLPFLKLAALN